MIDGPISDDFFWFDESETDSEFLDYDNDHLDASSNDDWGWDEWGDLVVFRPIGHEPRYQYPLVVWLSVNETPGITLRDWFPDLSDRNYVAAEVAISPETISSRNADRICLAIREIAAQYRLHRNRIWIAGVGMAADWVLKLTPRMSEMIAGGIAISPRFENWTSTTEDVGVLDQNQTLYLATEAGAQREKALSELARLGLKTGRFASPSWESIADSRLAICRDLNIWLMQQVCAPAGISSRD